MNDAGATSWRAIDEANLAAIPQYLLPWIALSTSMTRQLQDSLRSEVRVELLRDDTDRLNPDEEGFFDHTGGLARVREVCLHGAGRPVLVARTVYVSGKLACNPSLVSLGERPLGNLLFNASAPATWTRREFAWLDDRCALRHLVARHSLAARAPCGARRTLFWLDREPLLVTEILLPPVALFALSPDPTVLAIG